MYSLARQQEVPLSLDGTWQHLTEPRHLNLWFADVERLAPGEPFVFSFGDGDRFEGRVTGWDPPDRLQLEWRFLGLGPRFEITYHVGPLTAGRSEVTVVDRGSVTLEEVHALREGWEDFLRRLAAYAASGESGRYEWSRTIGLGATLGSVPEGGVPELDDPGWWQAAFGGAAVDLEARENGSRLLRVSEPSWGDVTTRAAVEMEEVETLDGEATYLGVVHEGWTLLPEDRQLRERERFAGLWRHACRDLEEKYS